MDNDLYDSWMIPAWLGNSLKDPWVAWLDESEKFTRASQWRLRLISDGMKFLVYCDVVGARQQKLYVPL